MKTLGRVLIILFAAALITGAMLALVNGNGSSSAMPFDRPGGAEFRPQGDAPSGEMPEGGFPEGMRPGRGGEGGRGGAGGTRWMFGLVKNVGVIALLVAVIVIPKSLFKKKATPQVAEQQAEEVQA
jgi:hypothetical protein